VFFTISAVFYLICSCLNPGFVKPVYSMQVSIRCLNSSQEMLEIANEKNIDLENFCFYCQVIKSNRTFHCMYCKSCVDKFDHHCAYINNCLGYRNHKYFILFLFSILIYFISSTIVCVAGITLHGVSTLHWYGVYIWIVRVYTISINLLQFIPLGYQIKE
jgi:hypothetical protein